MCEQFLLQQTAADTVKNTVIVAEHYHHQSVDSVVHQKTPQHVADASCVAGRGIEDPATCDGSKRVPVTHSGAATAVYLSSMALSLSHPLSRAFLPKSRSYQDVAQLASVPERILKSVARMAMTAGFLCETTKGKIAHTPLSAAFATNPDLYNWMMYMGNRTVPTMAKFVEATERWGDTTKKNETAYSLAMNTELSFFEHINSKRELNEEFGTYMKSQAASRSGTSVAFLPQSFDWAGLGEATVVDVGGGTGDASIELANRFPKLSFIVQDLANTIQDGLKRAASLPVESSQRIQYQVHDFFTPQPVRDAAVYLLRMIIHDWPHAESVSILQHLASVLKPRARIVIMDMVLPAPGSVPRTFEAMLRQKDLTMKQSLNACERELDDWQTLVQAVDSHLRIDAVTKPEGSQHSVLTLSLRQGSSGANGVNGVSE